MAKLLLELVPIVVFFLAGWYLRAFLHRTELTQLRAQTLADQELHDELLTAAAEQAMLNNTFAAVVLAKLTNHRRKPSP